MARRLARKLREASYLADAVSVERKLDERSARLVPYLLSDDGIEGLTVLRYLEVSRSLAADNRPHDFCGASFGVAFENLERVLVGRARVASDNAVDGGGNHDVHFPQISL